MYMLDAFSDIIIVASKLYVYRHKFNQRLNYYLTKYSRLIQVLCTFTVQSTNKLFYEHSSTTLVH